MPRDIIQILSEGEIEAVETVEGDTDVILLTITEEVANVEVEVPEGLLLVDAGPPQVGGITSEAFPFTHFGPLAVGMGTIKYPVKGGDFTITSVVATLTSPPTGSAAIIDVNVSGASIYGNQANRPTFAPGAYDAVVGQHSVASVLNGQFITIDIDQVGSTAPGTTLVGVIRLERIA